MNRCVFGVYRKCPAPCLKGRALSYRLVRGIMVLKPLVPISSGSYVDAYGPFVPLAASGLNRDDVVENEPDPGFIDWGFDPMPIACSDFYSKEDKWKYAAILLQVGVDDDESAYDEEKRFMESGAEGCLVRLHDWKWRGQEGHIPLLVQNRHVCVLCNKKFDIRCWNGRCDDCAETEATNNCLQYYFECWQHAGNCETDSGDDWYESGAPYLGDGVDY